MEPLVWGRVAVGGVKLFPIIAPAIRSFSADPFDLRRGDDVEIRW